MVQSNSKVIGAFVIGFAVVAGAYTMKNFGQPSTLPPNNLATATAIEAPARVMIDVTDSNNDGVEDWREEFVKSSPLAVVGNDDVAYVPPDTLTGQVGIAFIQNIISAKGYGSLGKSSEEITKETADKVSSYASDTIFDVKDIVISNDTSPEAIRHYGNAAADAILNNNVPGIKNEVLILRDVLSGESENGVEELKTLAQVYLSTRDDTLKIAVPQAFVKEHLDLINVYHAIYNDIESMTKVIDDPMLTLIRLKRYEEDAQGLALALQNMYGALEPHADAFQKDDSAILFVSFSPKLQ